MGSVDYNEGAFQSLPDLTMTTLTFWIAVPFGLSILIIYVAGRLSARSRPFPYSFVDPEKRKAFERWHDHQIKQMGHAANTLLTLAAAGFAYSLALLSGNSSISDGSHNLAIRMFTCAFAVSFLLGFFSIFNRLEDFKRTAGRHKFRDQHPYNPDQRLDPYSDKRKALYQTTRRLGAWTWYALYAQGLFFLIGSTGIIYFWMVSFADKL
jgi:hypothetical protein